MLIIHHRIKKLSGWSGLTSQSGCTTGLVSKGEAGFVFFVFYPLIAPLMASWAQYCFPLLCPIKHVVIIVNKSLASVLRGRMTRTSFSTNPNRFQSFSSTICSVLMSQHKAWPRKHLWDDIADRILNPLSKAFEWESLQAWMCISFLFILQACCTSKLDCGLS